MAQTFSNLSQLNAYIGKIVQTEIINFAEEVKKALKMELQSRFYGREGYGQNSNGTDWYSRTFQLIDCITVEALKVSGNTYSTRVFYDTDQMTTFPSYDKDGKTQWSVHESITDQEDIRQILPFWIEEGQDSPLYSWGGFHIVQDLTDRLIDDRALLLHFAHKFEQKGFKCVY